MLNIIPVVKGKPFQLLYIHIKEKLITVYLSKYLQLRYV